MKMKDEGLAEIMEMVSSCSHLERYQNSLDSIRFTLIVDIKIASSRSNTIDCGL